jgi:hypothetical protein
MFHSIGTRHAAAARLSVSMICLLGLSNGSCAASIEKHRSDAEIPLTDHNTRAPIIKPAESHHL